MPVFVMERDTMISWDERYSGEGFFYGTQPNEFLRDHAGALPAGEPVLCLGEGEGRNAVFLAERGFDVTAVDQSSVGLEKAVALAALRGVRIATVVADLADWNLERPGGWGGIVSIWCHLPSALRCRVHRQASAALQPGGVLILEAYTPEQLKFRTGGPADPDLMPTLAQLRGELAGLAFEVAQERQREVHEGRGHEGPSAVVQVVARRPA